MDESTKEYPQVSVTGPYAGKEREGMVGAPLDPILRNIFCFSKLLTVSTLSLSAPFF